MTTPQMDLRDTLDFWQREVDRDAADTRERTRDGIASSTLHWLRELERVQNEAALAEFNREDEEYGTGWISAPTNEYVPDTVSPPSETLRELMADRGWEPRDLAKAMGVEVRTVERLLADEIEYSPALAELIGKATGTLLGFWLSLYGQWRKAQRIEAITPENTHQEWPGDE